MWSWLKSLFRRRRTGVFTLSEQVSAPVSRMELEIFEIDAQRSGLSLEEWIRRTLNAGVSRETKVHLAKGREGLGKALDAAYSSLDDENDGSLPRIVRMPTPPAISGHPCRNLNPQIPSNYTANECQGTCTSKTVGFAGRPCFWAALAAKGCDAFEPKRVLPLSLPTKAGSR